MHSPMLITFVRKLTQAHTHVHIHTQPENYRVVLIITHDSNDHR